MRQPVVRDGRPRPISSSWIGSAVSANAGGNDSLNGSIHISDLYNMPGTGRLNATDLNQGFSGGPRLDLIHHGDDDADLEVVVFSDRRLERSQSIGPTPNDLLVMKAPGGFVQDPR